MKLTSLILEQLDREAELTRRALEQVPDGKNGWKPHAKSMPMGQLAHMVADIPTWISMTVNQDELDVKSGAAAGNGASRTLDSSEALVKALDKAVKDAREAVSRTTDKALQTPWRLLEGGKVVMSIRAMRLSENFNHLAHHRGQVTVYL